MKILIAAAVAAASLVAAGSAGAAVTVATGAAVSNPSLFNGLEGMAHCYPCSIPYSEGGITLTYVPSQGEDIWSYSQAYEGANSWYNSGGGNGYTSVTRTGGGAFSELSFAASSGFGPTMGLTYQALLGGAVVGTGAVGGIPGYSQGWRLLNVSGGTFDELRLKVNGDAEFNATTYEAGAYDAFAANGASTGAVPEPAAWALMIGGFGLAGATLRRRRAALAA